MTTEEIIKKIKGKKGNEGRSKYINNLFTRTLLSVILILGSMIFINFSEKNEELYRKYVFTESMAFNKVNKVYEKYIGDLNNKVSSGEQAVFQEMISYKSISDYLNGYKLEVGVNYLVPVLQSGIVVFNGEKEEYGKTLIIQGIDGVDIWYCGVNVHEVKLYDYVEKGSLLGESETEFMQVVLVKDGEYLNFEEYIKQD